MCDNKNLIVSYLKNKKKEKTFPFSSVVRLPSSILSLVLMKFMNSLLISKKIIFIIYYIMYSIILYYVYINK